MANEEKNNIKMNSFYSILNRQKLCRAAKFGVVEMTFKGENFI